MFVNATKDCDLHAFHEIFYKYEQDSKISVDKNNEDLLSFNDSIKYNCVEYVLDSVLINNMNVIETVKKIGSGHAICGITCNNERYVYNGWMRSTQDNGMKKNKQIKTIPCELMKFPWNVKKHQEFCLNMKKCNLPRPSKNEKLCFSFANADRNLIYVRKDISENVISIDFDKTPEYVSYNDTETKYKQKPKKTKKCPDGMIQNPKTNRCIKICPDGKDRNSTMDRCIKKCPDGKIRNQRTNRCNKICPNDKLRNPNTNRCIKKCPDGKIRNQRTDRCITPLKIYNGTNTS